MVNYFKQFQKLVEAENLKGTQISMDDFEHKIRTNFGLGSRKTLTKWINNFKDIGYIVIFKDSEGNWFVKFL